MKTQLLFMMLLLLIAFKTNAQSSEENFMPIDDEFPEEILPPGVTAPQNITTNGFSFGWIAYNYYLVYLDVSTNINFTSYVSGYQNKYVSSSPFIVTGLNPGTKYYYRLRSRFGGIYSEYSTVRSVTTQTAAPIATAATSVGRSSFTANWKSTTGASYYRLDVSENSSFTAMVSGYNNLKVTSNSKSVTGLNKCTYYYRVRAVNVSGAISSSSNAAIVKMKPATPSSKSETSVGKTSFTARWNSASCASNYYLTVATSSSFSSGSIVSGYNNLKLTGTSKSVTGLSGCTYYYRVRARNGSSPYSSYSGTITVKMKPATPSSKSETSVGKTSFTARWNSASCASNYYLTVATSSSFSSGSIVPGFNNLKLTGTSKSVTGLSGCTYYYRVRARNGDSPYTGYSGTITVKMKPATPVVRSESSVTTNSFVARWNSASCATKYYLTVATSSGFSSSSIVPGYNNLALSGTSKTVSGLSGCTYYYKVRAKNSDSPYSSYSGTNTVKMKTVKPVVISASNRTKTSFTARWNAVSCATEYRLDVSEVSDFSTKIVDNLSLTGTTYSLTGLSGCTYYYRVRARNGNSPISDNSSIMTVRLKPGAVVANAATNITASGFRASWSSDACASEYRIDVSMSSTFATIEPNYNNKKVTGTSLTVTGLPECNDCTYYYRVRSRNYNISSANSNTVTVILKPDKPVALAATSVTTNSFKANWHITSCATSYKLTVATDNAFTNILPGYNNLSLTTTSRSVTGLSAGTSYFYKLVAVNSSGNSVSSDIIEVITVPEAPVALSPVELKPNRFDARWNAVVGADKYLLDVSTNSGFSGYVGSYQNKEIEGDLTTFRVSGLTPGTVYYYRLRAKNAQGRISAYSNVIQQLTRPATPVPNAATNITDEGFTASWSSVPSADSYRLHVATDINFTNHVTGFSNKVVNGTSFTLTGLSGAATYYYRVRAHNAAGNSYYSAKITVLTLPKTPNASGATNVTASGFKAHWDLLNNVSQYRLYVSKQADFSSHISGYGPKTINGNSHTLSGLDGNTTYYYRVKGSNTTGNSAYSNIISVLTKPASPSISDASNITVNSFRANWVEVSGLTYLLDVSLSGDFSSFVSGYEGLNVTGGNYIVTGLNANTTYYFRVRAENATGISSFSSSRAATTLSNSSFAENNNSLNARTKSHNENGISDLNELEKIAVNVFPNPAVQYFTVQLEHFNYNENIKFRLFDAMGRLVDINPIKTAQSEYRFEISHLPNGIYILMMQNNGQLVKKNILKQ